MRRYRHRHRSRVDARVSSSANVLGADTNALPARITLLTRTARYAFHHFPDPAAVLAEMTRVCAPGGTVMVVDTQASPDPVKAAAFNRMERLRDPSHMRALPLAEHRALLRRAGLREPRETSYWLEMDLDSLLERCFPEPGDVDAIRETLSAAIEDDRLGIPVRARRRRVA
jgi:SAM-dependent methyltransferase